MAQFVTHIQPTLLEASQGHMPHHHGHQVGVQHASHLPHSGHNMPSPPTGHNHHQHHHQHHHHQQQHHATHQSPLSQVLSPPGNSNAGGVMTGVTGAHHHQPHTHQHHHQHHHGKHGIPGKHEHCPSGHQSTGDGNTSFLRAARAGNLERVLEHLKNNIDINTSNANGLNALHLASKDGHIHVVSELLRRGAIVDSATKKGNTALHIASLAGQEEVVKLLLQHGASVNVQSQNGFTPLYMAAQENHDSVVKLLLANGANQSLATEDGFTPLAVAMQQGHDKVVAVLLESDTRGKVRLPALHIAAKKDDVKAATLLLDNDHNPDVTSKSGFTPLHIASHYGNQNIANLLIEKGADVNFAAKHNISPLHVAAKWGKTNMVSLLLEKGAHIEAKTRDGLTPLHCAARSGHEQVVDMLLERGAPISAKTKNGLAPLHMAAQGEHVDAARILLYHRAPVDEVTVDYLTALHVAAHCGHVRVAKLLLDRNADANARALNGFTPLHIACKKNRIKVVELLLRHGASISATTESGLTPLHVAAFMGCMNIVIYLLQHDASPDVPTVRGETPLHLAARANQTDIIRILLRNGAQVDARAREQQTPLHIASRLGNVDIVMLLLQHGAQVDATTKDMYTALHIAAKEGQDEVAAVLIENGAALDAATKKGFTPLHLTAKYGHIKVAQLLLQKEADVDAQGKNGVTPLHVACHYDNQNVALLLLEKGASPHATAKNGHTPLHIAARKNQMDIATTLLEYGAQASAESKAGFTPLHLSCQEGHAEISNLLIEHKAGVNHPAKNGLTPMHLCAQEDNVNVAEILQRNGANIDMATKAGYTPLHVAAHFGQANMVRFLLQHGANVDAANSLGYTPLHQTAQQGHCHIVNLLLEHKANANAQTVNGQTPLHIARKLGYISVLDSLKSITKEDENGQQHLSDEKYRVVAPEAMHESFMSDSEEEGGEDNMLSDQPYRYLTVDEMKSLGDDSLPIDVTRDERVDSNRMVQSADYGQQRHQDPIAEDIISPHKAQVHGTGKSVIDGAFITNGAQDEKPYVGRKLTWKSFLVSFLVDARGGAMRGCRHSGVRMIIPSRSTCQPTRITCRYVKPQRTMHPPQLMEGEALASRVLELGPVSTKFIGPVVMEVPHFASLRGKEREIIILRSDNGETWREHTIDNSEEIIHDVMQQCFEPEEIVQLEEQAGNHVCRFITYDFPQYFAVVSRIRQEVHAIGPEGGMVSSTVVPQVQAVFPQGALTKKIKVGLQAQPVDPDLTAKLLGRGVAVSPIVTVEPRRRKFHKAITLSMPAPKAHSQGMINQYSGNTPTLRLLCSITGGPSRAQWEDVTGSTPLTFVNDCVSFTTTVSARFWLMDCRNISEATKMATELYKEVIHVPFMAKFVVFAKKIEPYEARLRVFCMTDDREDKTLEKMELFTEVAKSRDVEVLEGKAQFIEMAGNLIPVTKSGEQLQLPFKAFRENRLPFTVRVKDQHADIVGRTLFMKEPKIAKGEPPQHPICILNIVLPEAVIPDSMTAFSDKITSSYRTSLFSMSKHQNDHYIGDIRIVDLSNLLGKDWIQLAPEIGISIEEIDEIINQHTDSIARQAQSMIRLYKDKANYDIQALEAALTDIGREDIMKKCKSGRLSHSRDFDDTDIMKNSESVEELVRQESKRIQQIHEREEIKYSAEEKEIEESESDEETAKRTVAERREKIVKRLSIERQIPASSQKKEITKEITEIKRKSLIEDKKAIHESEIMMQLPTDNIVKSSVVPEQVIKMKMGKMETVEVSKSDFDKELSHKLKTSGRSSEEEEEEGGGGGEGGEQTIAELAHTPGDVDNLKIVQDITTFEKSTAKEARQITDDFLNAEKKAQLPVQTIKEKFVEEVKEKEKEKEKQKEKEKEKEQVDDVKQGIETTTITTEKMSKKVESIVSSFESSSSSSDDKPIDSAKEHKVTESVKVSETIKTLKDSALPKPIDVKKIEKVESKIDEKIADFEAKQVKYEFHGTEHKGPVSKIPKRVVESTEQQHIQQQQQPQQTKTSTTIITTTTTTSPEPAPAPAAAPRKISDAEKSLTLTKKQTDPELRNLTDDFLSMEKKLQPFVEIQPPREHKITDDLVIATTDIMTAVPTIEPRLSLDDAVASTDLKDAAVETVATVKDATPKMTTTDVKKLTSGFLATEQKSQLPVPSKSTITTAKENESLAKTVTTTMTGTAAVIGLEKEVSVKSETLDTKPTTSTIESTSKIPTKIPSLTSADARKLTHDFIAIEQQTQLHPDMTQISSNDLPSCPVQSKKDESVKIQTLEKDQVEIPASNDAMKVQFDLQSLPTAPLDSIQMTHDFLSFEQQSQLPIRKSEKKLDVDLVKEITKDINRTDDGIETAAPIKEIDLMHSLPGDKFDDNISITSTHTDTIDKMTTLPMGDKDKYKEKETIIIEDKTIQKSPLDAIKMTEDFLGIEQRSQLPTKIDQDIRSDDELSVPVTIEPRKSLTDAEFCKSVQDTITKKMSEGLIEISDDLQMKESDIPDSQTPPPTPIDTKSERTEEEPLRAASEQKDHLADTVRTLHSTRESTFERVSAISTIEKLTASDREITQERTTYDVSYSHETGDDDGDFKGKLFMHGHDGGNDDDDNNDDGVIDDYDNKADHHNGSDGGDDDDKGDDDNNDEIGDDNSVNESDGNNDIRKKAEILVENVLEESVQIISGQQQQSSDHQQIQRKFSDTENANVFETSKYENNSESENFAITCDDIGGLEVIKSPTIESMSGRSFDDNMSFTDEHLLVHTIPQNSQAFALSNTIATSSTINSTCTMTTTTTLITTDVSDSSHNAQPGSTIITTATSATAFMQQQQPESDNKNDATTIRDVSGSKADPKEIKSTNEAADVVRVRRLERKFEKLSSTVQDIDAQAAEFDEHFDALVHEDELSVLQGDFSKLSWDDSVSPTTNTLGEIGQNTPDNDVQDLTSGGECPQQFDITPVPTTETTLQDAPTPRPRSVKAPTPTADGTTTVVTQKLHDEEHQQQPVDEHKDSKEFEIAPVPKPRAQSIKPSDSFKNLHTLAAEQSDSVSLRSLDITEDLSRTEEPSTTELSIKSQQRDFPTTATTITTTTTTTAASEEPSESLEPASEISLDNDNDIKSQGAADKTASFYIGESSRNIITKSTRSSNEALAEIASDDIDPKDIDLMKEGSVDFEENTDAFKEYVTIKDDSGQKIIRQGSETRHDVLEDLATTAQSKETKEPISGSFEESSMKTSTISNISAPPEMIQSFGDDIDDSIKDISDALNYEDSKKLETISDLKSEISLEKSEWEVSEKEIPMGKSKVIHSPLEAQAPLKVNIKEDECPVEKSLEEEQKIHAAANDNVEIIDDDDHFIEDASSSQLIEFHVLEENQKFLPVTEPEHLDVGSEETDISSFIGIPESESAEPEMKNVQPPREEQQFNEGLFEGTITESLNKQAVMAHYAQNVFDDLKRDTRDDHGSLGFISTGTGEEYSSTEQTAEVIKEEHASLGFISNETAEDFSSMEDYYQEKMVKASVVTEEPEASQKSLLDGIIGHSDSDIAAKPFDVVVHRVKTESSNETSNRWSVPEIDQSSSSESYYRSFEKTESRPLSSDVENLLTLPNSSEYQTAADVSSVLRETTEYMSAKSALESSSGKTISSRESMKSLDSQSEMSANLGSIDVSELSETLVASSTDADALEAEELAQVRELRADDEDSEGSGEISDKFGIIVGEGQTLQSAMKRSQEMVFKPKTDETEERRIEAVEIEEFPKPKEVERAWGYAYPMEDNRMEDLKESDKSEDILLYHGEIRRSIDESKLASSLDEGSILSVSMSSTSNIDTVVENFEEMIGSAGSSSLTGIEGFGFAQEEQVSSLPEETFMMEMDSKEGSPQDSTATTPPGDGRKRGHKRNESTSITGDEIKNLTDRDLPIVGEGKESESESDTDPYESEYARQFRCPNERKPKKKKQAAAEMDHNLETEKRPFTPSQLVAEVIIEDAATEELEAEEAMIEERRPSQNMLDYSNIPDITVTEDIPKESPIKEEDETIFEEKTLYKVKTQEELHKASDVPLHQDTVATDSKEESFQKLVQEQYKQKLAELKRAQIDASDYDDEKAPDSPDSFEMVEQPDISDEFVIIEEVAKEAGEVDLGGKSIKIQPTKQESQHDEEVEKIIIRSAPADPKLGSQIIRDDLNFEFEESPPTGGSSSDQQEESDSGDMAGNNKRWVEMQLTDTQLRYPYDITGGVLEDIKEEDGEFEVGSSRISSFKDSFSSTPEYDVLAARRYYARGEHDDVSMSSLQEFESLEQAISLENRNKTHQGSTDSSNGSFTRRYIVRHSGSGTGQGDDISLSSLKEFEGLETACIEAHMIEIKAKEEAALLSRSDESNKSSGSDRENGASNVVVTKVTRTITRTEVPVGQQQNIEAILKQKLEECETKGSTVKFTEVPAENLDLKVKIASQGSEKGSVDSLEINKSLDVMTSSIDSFDISKDATSRSEIDSLEVDRKQPTREESIESIENEQIELISKFVGGGGTTFGDGLTTTATTTTTSTDADGREHTITRVVTTTTSVTSGGALELPTEFIPKDSSVDSLNLCVDQTTSSAGTTATYQTSAGDSQMSGSVTSCASSTLMEDSYPSTLTEDK